jgi:hypothetical protein
MDRETIRLKMLRRSASIFQDAIIGPASCMSSSCKVGHTGFAPDIGQGPPVRGWLLVLNARRSLSRVPGNGPEHPVHLPGAILANIAC